MLTPRGARFLILAAVALATGLGVAVIWLRAEWARDLVGRAAGSSPPAISIANFVDRLVLIALLLAALAVAITYVAARALKAHRDASHLDALTGLYNRRLFNELLADEVAQAGRYGRDLSLGIVDLDGFKSINDTLGHRAGDRVLQGAADVMRSSVRKSDHVFRYGGEEFAILMPETGELAAAVALERVRRALEERAIAYGRGEAQVRCSIGVTAYQAPESEEELVVRADRACYAAKRRGRNQVVLERLVDGQSRELSLADLQPLPSGGIRA